MNTQRRSPRLADVVADGLRSQILSGKLADGATVPKQEELVAKFRVSPPSIREGLRILETEGLISVVRGNVGGSIVHAPRADGVAYMTALVLESQGAYLDDVYAAIRAIEPICAAMAAARKDRARAVVPVLRKSIAAQRDARDKSDIWRFFLTARSFHTDLVSCSGNRTVSLIAGALESIWAAHVVRLDADDPASLGVYAEDAEHTRTLTEHQHILDTIIKGDSVGVETLVRSHLVDAERHPLLGKRQPVKATLMRDAEVSIGVNVQRRSARLADVVADGLRSQILSGKLADGATVPKQEELVAKFRVSPPSIREGLRILETEGLISVVRGNVGGSIVHAPRADGVAYMTALVLESQGAYLDDVYAAIRAIEPICAAMAAARKDRARAVVPVLRKSIAAQRDARDKSDIWRFFLTARSFHTDLVSCSGNRTVSLIAGALESIWAAHVVRLDADDPASLGVYAEDAEHTRTLTEHQHILDTIIKGDSVGVETLVRSHLVDAERHPLLGGRQPVKATPMPFDQQF